MLVVAAAALLIGGVSFTRFTYRELITPPQSGENSTSQTYISETSSTQVITGTQALPAIEEYTPEAVSETGQAVTVLAPVQPVSPALPSQIVLVDGGANWDTMTRAQILEAIALLPRSVLSHLGNSGLGPIIINVNSEGRTLGGRQPYGAAANFFSTNEGRNELVLFPQQGTLTVLHELGHAFNLRNIPAGSYAQVMLDQEMQSFLAVAGWQILTPAETLKGLKDQAKIEFRYGGPVIWPNPSREDPLEDFANSFAYYFAAPETLRQLSPERYQWFASLMSSVARSQ